MTSVPQFAGSAAVDSVNIGAAEPNPYKETVSTGINKRPIVGRVEVRAPGPRHGAEQGGPKHRGSGSGLVGDFIGDTAHHGGDDQAVYAFAREDLDAWQQRLGRPLPNGFFGENLTTRGIDVNDARIGERWRIGDHRQADHGQGDHREGDHGLGDHGQGDHRCDCLVLEVTYPRIPCSTFRGWVGEQGWLRTFTRVARPGAYFRVISPGTVGADDPITVLRRPDHDVSIALVYRATTTERELLPRLLAAGDDLPEQTRRLVTEQGGFDLC